MHPTECFVIIQKLPRGTFHPSWFRPAPLPGNPSHVWRFALGGMHTAGYTDLKSAQIQAKILGENIARMSTGALGQLYCPEQNIVLTRVLSVAAPLSVMVLPAFGPLTSMSLLDVLDKSAPADAGEKGRLIH